MTTSVRVNAASRLHFGLMAFATSGDRSFAGVGAMIASPRLEISLEPSDRLEGVGADSGRAIAFAKMAARQWGMVDAPLCRITVHAAPPAHRGFGSGTQLALAVAAGLRAFWRLAPLDATRLAASVGRARRSSVGVHGFLRGGLIVDGGHAPGAALGAMLARRSMPDAWRFVLIEPPGEMGRFGESELRAFAELPPIPRQTTDQLMTLAMRELAPAAATGDFNAFSNALYEYGHLAGECFASCQGGPFANDAIAAIVRALRTMRVDGVGQSSWGPTTFAMAENETHAKEIVAKLRAEPIGRACRLSIATPCNRGADVASFSNTDGAKNGG